MPDEETANVNTLTKGIKYAMGYKEKDSEKLAYLILDMANEDDYILDITLEPDERGVFYDLQEKKILGTDRDETVLGPGPKVGRYWRTNFWKIEWKNIAGIIAKAEAPEIETEQTVYTNSKILPEDAWVRTKPAQTPDGAKAGANPAQLY